MLFHLELFSRIQSLRLGGLIGIGLSAILYNAYPFSFGGLTDRASFIIYGGVIGCVIGRGISTILSPILKFGAYCEKLIEIQVTFKAGIIGWKQYEQITKYLVYQRFGLLDQDEPHPDKMEKV